MKNFLPLIVVFIALNVFAQKEANFWYFGNGAALDFNSGSPIPVSGSQLNTLEGCSSFSDANGNLLFYVGAPTNDDSLRTSRNLTIWDKNNNPMPNATGLKGDSSSSQSALTVPAPGKPNIYYLFTVGTTATGNAPFPGTPGFFYYEIDMSLNNGLGDINTSIGDAGAINLSSGKDNLWSEKVTAVRAAACNSFWVISMAQGTAASGNNEFYAYKVNESGVDVLNPVISVIPNFSTDDQRGYLKVSPDGSKLVAANMSSGTFIFDFDATTGLVSNLNGSNQVSRLDTFGSGSADGYGVEFSITSNVLYISTGFFNNESSNANLYQYDLKQASIEEINNSRELIMSYRNSRAALQLGPDGKIYWSANNSNNISVINRPDELGENCDYSHLSVPVGATVTASQGLPPFLSSLLLPIEVTDNDSDTVINNQDLSFCAGSNKTIVPEVLSGTDISYEWFFNDGTTRNTVTTNPNLVFTNLANADSGTYTLEVNLTDECGNITRFEANFAITVFEAANATKPEDIIFCDTDNDGFNTFDLQATKSIEIRNGLDAGVFDVLYFDNLTDANSGENALPNPYTNQNPFSSQTIYARIQNIFVPDVCFDITEFELAVTGLPTPTQPEPYRICDDIESSSDTDGIINTFLLNTKDTEILGTLSNTQNNVSYHTTQIGAINNDASTIIDKNNDYTVTNSETVFIRVENVDNSACFNANLTLELIVDPLPVLLPNPILQHCVATGTANPTVNLTLAEPNISNTTNVTFQYFTDAAGTNQITAITSYPVQTNLTQSVFVSVTTNQNCARDLVELQINVGEESDSPYADLQTPACDDFLQADGTNGPNNNDTDNITTFMLDKNTIDANIFNGAMITNRNNLEILYFENNLDRNNSLNQIDITNYRNNLSKIDITTNANGIRFPIYYKILSTINNNCQGLGQFFLQINTVPTAEIVPDLELCDDNEDGMNTNGIVQNFNLENKTTDILGTQNDTDFKVTYHLTATDANTGNAPILSPFANTIANSQEIFVRVTNNVTGCYTSQTSFNVIVNPVPVANFVPDLEVCDDNSDGSARNGFSQSIDLEAQTTTILGTQDLANHTVTYHRSLADAQSGNLPLMSPYTNLAPNRETIFVRIVNNTTGCANGISNFDVLVNPEPTFNPVSNLSFCDDAVDGDDANGIIQNIDLDSQIPALLGNAQDPDDFIVTFHNSSANASSGADAILSPYTNTSSTETIFVRIQNKATFCVNDDATFDVIVNPLPNFNVTSPQIVCLNNTPLPISAENPSEIYTYEWKDMAGNVVGNSQTLDVVVGGNYTVTATTTNGTDCSRTEIISVNESNPAILLPEFVTVVDEGNNIGSENNLSVNIDIINNNLGIGDYQFALRNDDENTTTLFQDEPIFENLAGGIYTIIVNDKNGCSPDTTLQISVLQFPKFFTPNGDGVNDTWVVKGANKAFYPNSSINIFNRFGKLVAQIPLESGGWNGTFNGKLLSSDDYWYNITLIPADTSKPTIHKKGNFSLLRRR
ncbi:T9SS type B sorting domain-containing protein [uncultured Polaribacter sp.]|uniref:T9SS type B sorting domain-containing protein n=1 Tax=uncultured Polaribacter sp. TaxID=174711 RepID=UPI00261D9845|nr:T9SS type B sorting domain-containing protein [uncultured Polaribacter sp.]